MNLATILQYLYPEASPVTDYAVAQNQQTAETEIVRWSPALGDQPTSAELAAAELPAHKVATLRIIRADAAALIVAKWPAWAQTNCALGIYPEATAAQCSADIAAVVTASNAAEDAVTAATTVAEVEAVTATWPTL